VSSLSPASGPVAGGTLVTISGIGLTGATGVKFGTAAATLANVISDGEIRAVAPAAAAGTVDVTVTGPTGTSTTSADTKFTYTSPQTPTTKTTTTTTATTPTTASPIVARIVYATVLGTRAQRKLDIRIRASKPGKARLQLVKSGATKVQKTFAIKGGPNELKIRLPANLAKGSYLAKLTLSAPNTRTKTYTTTVLVPR
jgi:IPT/TIG domain-containing protein